MLYKSRARRCDAETKLGIIMTESKAMQSEARHMSVQYSHVYIDNTKHN